MSQCGRDQARRHRGARGGCDVASPTGSRCRGPAPLSWRPAPPAVPRGRKSRAAQGDVSVAAAAAAAAAAGPTAR